MLVYIEDCAFPITSTTSFKALERAVTISKATDKRSIICHYTISDVQESSKIFAFFSTTPLVKADQYITVGDLIDNSGDVFRTLYDIASKHVELESIPENLKTEYEERPTELTMEEFTRIANVVPTITHLRNTLSTAPSAEYIKFWVEHTPFPTTFNYNDNDWSVERKVNSIIRNLNLGLEELPSHDTPPRRERQPRQAVIQQSDAAVDNRQDHVWADNASPSQILQNSNRRLSEIPPRLLVNRTWAPHVTPEEINIYETLPLNRIPPSMLVPPSLSRTHFPTLSRISLPRISGFPHRG